MKLCYWKDINIKDEKVCLQFTNSNLGTIKYKSTRMVIIWKKK